MSEFQVFLSDTYMDIIDAARRVPEAERTTEQRDIVAWADGHRARRYAQFSVAESRQTSTTLDVAIEPPYLPQSGRPADRAA